MIPIKDVYPLIILFSMNDSYIRIYIYDLFIYDLYIYVRMYNLYVFICVFLYVFKCIYLFIYYIYKYDLYASIYIYLYVEFILEQFIRG